jgi:hypothetical protein
MLKMPGNGIEFELDRDQCAITGHFCHGQSAGPRTWSLRVQCGEARFLPLEGESAEAEQERRDWFEFVANEGCHAELVVQIPQVASWRDLAGKRLLANYPRSAGQAIMPDDPGVFYFAAHHMIANRNRIAFGARRGTFFPVHWKFEALESDEFQDGDEPRGQEVEVKAYIPVRRFSVSFQDPSELSFAAALATVAGFADDDELGEPQEHMGRYVYLPILDGT